MPIGRRSGLRRHRHRRPGFTLIELLVVMSIIGLLASLVAPRYMHSLDRAKEKSLATTLAVMRDAIDQFTADKGRYPGSLAELSDASQGRYLRGLPQDPLTGRTDSWLMLAPPANSLITGAVADVRSGAPGQGSDGRRYADW